MSYSGATNLSCDVRSIQIMGHREAYYDAIIRVLPYCIGCCIMLSLKNSNKVYKLIHLFMWLSLVNTEHLRSSANKTQST